MILTKGCWPLSSTYAPPFHPPKETCWLARIVYGSVWTIMFVSHVQSQDCVGFFSLESPLSEQQEDCEDQFAEFDNECIELESQTPSLIQRFYRWMLHSHRPPRQSRRTLPCTQGHCVRVCFHRVPARPRQCGLINHSGPSESQREGAVTYIWVSGGRSGGALERELGQVWDAFNGNHCGWVPHKIKIDRCSSFVRNTNMVRCTCRSEENAFNETNLYFLTSLWVLWVLVDMLS